jgi:hypothetical protein
LLPLDLRSEHFDMTEELVFRLEATDSTDDCLFVF